MSEFEYGFEREEGGGRDVRMRVGRDGVALAARAFARGEYVTVWAGMEYDGQGAGREGECERDRPYTPVLAEVRGRLVDGSGGGGGAQHIARHVADGDVLRVPNVTLTPSGAVQITRAIDDRVG